MRRPRRWRGWRRAGLIEPILRWIARGRPFLGICLGLQLLFEGSDEDGARTLGVLPGRTVRLDAAPTLPHIGWNQVERTREHPLFTGIADRADFYFVHSYAGRPVGDEGTAATLAETEHGRRFVSGDRARNVLGVQFHPERSGATACGCSPTSSAGPGACRGRDDRGAAPAPRVAR